MHLDIKVVFTRDIRLAKKNIEDLEFNDDLAIFILNILDLV